MLTDKQAIDQVEILKQHQQTERAQLDVLRRYWKGKQALPGVIPNAAPREVRIMARIARVNVCPIVVDSLAQSTFVDGFRDTGGGNDPLWKVWQANKMDARQTGLHRAAFAYGTAYAVVMPGTPVPLIRQVSPRQLFVAYGEDPDWPMWGLERLGRGLWKLYDDTAVYYVSEETQVVNPNTNETRTSYTFVEAREHGAGVVPIVRYQDEIDLDIDDDVQSALPDDIWPDVPAIGQISPLMAIQDQIDLTTFGLLVAQWYSAFRQRYIIGWVPESEAQLMKASASQVWTFDDSPDGTPGGDGGVKVGEFGQTDLGGYIESRDALVKYAATLSQTPVHELVGELVNLSAEALAAAEAGHDRKVDERKTNLGEAHEQMFGLLGVYTGHKVPDDAEVVWRDTSARSFAATVDALGKLVSMLGVPPEELWERIPGVTQQDIARWKTSAQRGDAFQQLAAILDRQSQTTQAAPTTVTGP